MKPKPSYVYVDHDLSAAALRQGRRQLGLMQREMAEALNMSSATYNACENGKRRFPFARLNMLPPDIAANVRDAFVAEFRTELNRKIAKPRIRARRRTKPLAAVEAAV